MTENETTGAPTALPELTESALQRIGTAWGTGPEETRALWAQAREAFEAEQEERLSEQEWEQGEKVAYAAWAKAQPAAGPFDAWLARARIHRSYEAHVDAETRKAMDITSEQVNGLQAEVTRLKAELRRMRAERDILVAQLSIVKAENEADAMEPAPTGKITAEDFSDARAAFTATVLRDVAAERVAQFKKWGTQRWPLLPLTNGTTPQRAGCLGIVSSLVAKDRCKRAFDAGMGTFGHILVKEVSEAIDAPTTAEMRAELIQVAAVAVQMVEVIDAGNNPDG